mmetsp:Transcript_7641/g.17619  ORF Transcript_7641/g.17619 Transcript_7641/m.17619 type:complete len:256 (-) Transcript_7641:1089-1856(-)
MADTTLAAIRCATGAVSRSRIWLRPCLRFLFVSAARRARRLCHTMRICAGFTRISRSVASTCTMTTSRDSSEVMPRVASERTSLAQASSSQRDSPRMTGRRVSEDSRGGRVSKAVARGSLSRRNCRRGTMLTINSGPPTRRSKEPRLCWDGLGGLVGVAATTTAGELSCVSIFGRGRMSGYRALTTPTASSTSAGSAPLASRQSLRCLVQASRCATVRARWACTWRSLMPVQLTEAPKHMLRYRRTIKRSRRRSA